MDQHDQLSNPAPRFSIIVAAYDDWMMLDGCLRALSQQEEVSFEVIVVDDGSKESAPDYVQRWSNRYPLSIVRQDHAGISAARNRGIKHSRAPVLLFIDADSRTQVKCLTALALAIDGSPDHSFFQLRLVGDYSGAVGRAEDLRLTALQHHLLQPNGCIRYLNTAGFAVRREKLDTEADLFDPAALRGEDTLVLANLMQRGNLPLFVPEAKIQHTVPLSFMGCLRKDIRTAYLEARTFEMILSKGVRIRMSNRERFRMLRSTWKASAQDSIGRSAWFVLVARQSLQRIISLIYWSFRTSSRTRRATSNT
jgi:glycosyltransferase involved in cell wall biosynthesis